MRINFGAKPMCYPMSVSSLTPMVQMELPML